MTNEILNYILKMVELLLWIISVFVLILIIGYNNAFSGGEYDVDFLFSLFIGTSLFWPSAWLIRRYLSRSMDEDTQISIFKSLMLPILIVYFVLWAIITLQCILDDLCSPGGF